jgi:replicative DNA helicase
MKTLADLLPNWFDDLQSGEPPVRWKCGLPLEMAPGRLMLLAGAPGSGKTALATQCVIDALRLNPKLRGLIANVEMSPADLLDRSAARIGGVPLAAIRERQLTAEALARLATAREELAAIADRLAFAESYDLRTIAADADTHEADVLSLDYIQRIRPAAAKEGDRENLDSLVDGLRKMATAGAFVLCISAVSRQRDAKGKATYSDLGLASFRGSSELEFGCDSAFILDPADGTGRTVLKCHKDRHGEPADLPMRFRRKFQRFDSDDSNGPATAGDAGNDGDARPPKFNAELAGLWGDSATTTTTTEGADDEAE